MTSREDGVVSYRTIIEWLSERGPASPRDIAESRRRESVIRVKCRTLRECGLLERITRDVFVLSERGRRYLADDVALPEECGDVAVDELRSDSTRTDVPGRITDVSSVDAETIIAFNFDRYENDHYGLVRESRSDTKRRIGNVSESDLDRVIRELPRNEPVVQQCAHWVRAISGLHFFPDANHRTAIGGLRALLYFNDVALPENWPGRELRRTVLKAKFVRNFVVDVRFDNLWTKDELYQLWHRHFRNLFLNVEDMTHHARSTERLGRALDAARKRG